MSRVKQLTLGIIIVSLLLACCIAVDYADEPIITISNQSMDYGINATNTTLVNGTYCSVNNDSGMAKLHGVVKEKHKLPLITITAKPSCGCRNSYRWHTRTFINYCPYCHRYGVLTNLHKYSARWEQEISCKRCSADFCGVCGKEKYGWSRRYLRRV